MTQPRTIDITPSAIARKLLPDDASDSDRALIEAMAEAALRRVPECKSSVGAFFFIERLMVNAGVLLMKQHDIRCTRAMKFLASLQDEPDAPYDAKIDGALDDANEDP